MLTGQVVLPVYTNMTDFRKYIRPGVITLRQEFRLPGGVLGRLTAGNFTDNRMGVDAALRYQPARGRWLVGANVGLTGSSTCYGGNGWCRPGEGCRVPSGDGITNRIMVCR